MSELNWAPLQPGQWHF